MLLFYLVGRFAGGGNILKGTRTESLFIDMRQIDTEKLKRNE